MPTNLPRPESTARASEPATPSRVRLVRPAFYRSVTTGSLAPDVRDLLVGLMVLADDEGWTLWRPSEIAAAVYPYKPAGRRLRDLERRAADLEAAGLLVIEPCGCAKLPTLQRDHGVKGGTRSAAVWGWHSTHPDRHVQTSTDKSVSSSVSVSASSSSSDSDSVSASASSRAQGALPPRVIDALKKRTNGNFGELTEDLVETARTFLEGKAINEELLITYIGGLNPNGVPADATFYLREALAQAGRS